MSSLSKITEHVYQLTIVNASPVTDEQPLKQTCLLQELGHDDEVAIVATAGICTSMTQSSKPAVPPHVSYYHEQGHLLRVPSNSKDPAKVPGVPSLQRNYGGRPTVNYGRSAQHITTRTVDIMIVVFSGCDGPSFVSRHAFRTHLASLMNKCKKMICIQTDSFRDAYRTKFTTVCDLASIPQRTLEHDLTNVQSEMGLQCILEHKLVFVGENVSVASAVLEALYGAPSPSILKRRSMEYDFKSEIMAANLLTTTSNHTFRISRKKVVLDLEVGIRCCVVVVLADAMKMPQTETSPVLLNIHQNDTSIPPITGDDLTELCQRYYESKKKNPSWEERKELAGYYYRQQFHLHALLNAAKDDDMITLSWESLFQQALQYCMNASSSDYPPVVDYPSSNKRQCQPPINRHESMPRSSYASID